MRRLATILALALSCTGCVTDQSSETTRTARRPQSAKSRYRPYRVPAPPPPRPTAPTPRYAPPPQRLAQTWYPANGAISSRWTTVVIHHSATDGGNAAIFDKSHREKNGWDELGYHFVIGNGSNTPDGFVEIGPRWHKQKHGAHCKTPGNYYNEHGVGICLVGDFTHSRPTQRQMASLNDLLLFLTSTCRIDASRVTTHGAVTGKTQCPGQMFSLHDARRTLASSQFGDSSSSHTALRHSAPDPANSPVLGSAAYSSQGQSRMR